MIAQLMLLAAAAGHCALDDAGYCTDPVVTYSLNSAEPNPRVRVNVHLGSVMAVQLPEGDELRTEPAVGNAAVFQLKLQKDPLELLLWPRVPKGSLSSSVSLEGEISNVQIPLASGINVLLEMRISVDAGVQRLILRSPEVEKRLQRRESLREEIRAEIEAEMQHRRENLEVEAHERSLQLIAKGILTRVDCVQLNERAARGLLVVHGTMICHIGDYIALKYAVHNRARAMFSLKALQVYAKEGDKLNALDAIAVWEGGKSPQLRFDQKATGVALVPITDESSAVEYAIRVTESGGKHRDVTLEGLEF